MSDRKDKCISESQSRNQNVRVVLRQEKPVSFYLFIKPVFFFFFYGQDHTTDSKIGFFNE